MSENKLFEARQVKLGYVSGIMNPYPERFEKTHEIGEIAVLLEGTAGVRTAGRIMSIRKMGKLSFLTIGDISGKVQVAIKKDTVGESEYEFFKKGFDIGDFIGVEGEIFFTNAGEKTIRSFEIYFLGKSLRPLPEKFHGINNIEISYRQRYLDLCVNDDTKERFMKKFQFIKELRRYLEDNAYVEIEIPVLIDHPSGAAARPFVSHHNALDMEVYLRIAPETYLKRAIVGGFTKVFEFARCFRNEGIDATHLQDFTMLEGYCAYYNYKDNMRFLQEMLTNVVTKIWGSPQIVVKDNIIDFAGTWEIRCKANGDEEAMMMDEDYIMAMEYGMPPISGWGMGIDRVFQVLTGTDNIRDSIMFPLMKPITE